MVAADPPGFSLSPPFPNPLFSGRTLTIRFSVPAGEAVAFELFDIAGRRAAAGGPGTMAAADEREINWTPGPLASGVYFLKLVGQYGEVAHTSLVVLK